MELTPEQKTALQALISRLSQHPAFYSAAAADQPPACRAAIEAYRQDLETSLDEEGPWSDLRANLLDLADQWLQANQDVKRIKAQAKNGRFRSFCGALRAFQGNFSDVLRTLAQQAGVDYPKAFQPRP